MLKVFLPSLLSAFIFMTFSCTSDNNATLETGSETADDEIRYLNADDENVKRAHAEAQENLPALEKHFLENVNDKYLIYVKVEFQQAAEVEHMWGVLLGMNDQQYTIRLDNEPVSIHNVEYGDTLKVDKTVIEDFLVYEGEEIILGDFMNWLLLVE